MTSIEALTFADPDEFSQAVRAGGMGGYVAKNPRHFRADLTRVALDKLWLQAASESGARSAHLSIAINRSPIFFLADEHEQTIQQSGVDISPSEIVFFGRGASLFQRTPAPSNWSSMSLSPVDLAEASFALLGSGIEAPAATRVIRPSRFLMTRLRGLHEAMRRIVGHTGQEPRHPEVIRSIEQRAIETMVACLSDGDDVQVDRRCRNHAAVMARFEDWLQANLPRPVYLLEACTAVGASERTLRACCQEHLGVSPTKYLWLRRMHLARATLLCASATETTVTTIATSLGFWHLGRFAIEYRTQFGESPRTTLARTVPTSGTKTAGASGLRKTNERTFTFAHS